MAKTAIVPGSFDPITIGHIDIIKRAANLFDKVYVLAVFNAAKEGFYTPEERLAIMKSALRDIDNVECAVYDGLTSDFASKIGADVMVRGARNGSDYDAEYNFCEIIKHFKPDMESIIIPSNPELAYISSTYVRELIRHDCPLDNVIDPETASLMRKFYNK